MNLQTGLSTDWTSAQWRIALGLVWANRAALFNTKSDERIFTVTMDRLLHALDEARTTSTRTSFGRAIRRLIARYPTFSRALVKAVTLADLEELSLAPAQQVEQDRGDSRGRKHEVLDAKGPKAQIEPAPSKVHRFITLPVWYITDRKPTGNANPSTLYGTRASGTVRMGRADVTIPEVHRKGTLERPKRILWTIELREEPARHFTLATVTEMDADHWLAELRSAVVGGRGDETSRDILLFVHGYNTTWKQSVLRAAQLARDVDFFGQTIAYSWSSKGRPLAYPKDSEAVADTRRLLAQSLSVVLRSAGARRVHIVAHSMGNRAVIGALRSLAARPLPKSSAELRELVFAAPDVGTGEFVSFVDDYFNGLHSAFNRRSGNQARLTLYACENDYALRLSRDFQEMSRAGDSAQQLVVVPPLETIDVSRAIVSADSHGYVVTNRDVLTDLFGALRQRSPRDRPNLESREAEAGSYWAMRR